MVTNSVTRFLDRLPFRNKRGDASSRNGIKTVGSGVQWVGSPDTRHIIRLDTVVDPDAEELTRQIALATSAYCYTAVMYRASKMAEPPPVLLQETEEGDEAVIDHELITLFSDPSLDFDMVELLALTEAYRLTTGAALWLKQRDTADRVGALQPFSGDEVQTFAADGRIYGHFKVLTAHGAWKDYEPEDVVFIRDLNPNSWRTNLSRLEVALSQLDLGHQVNRTVRNFMKKAMFPGGVISPDKEWDPEDDEWLEYKNTIEAWYSGPAAAGTPLILQGGTTFSRAAIPLKELLPSELLDRIEAVVSSTFGVPPIVLGWKIGLENSPWSQMGEARQTVYEETFIPRWQELGRKIGRQMLTPEERTDGIKIGFDLTNIAALRADDEARAVVASKLRDEWTRNERRSYTGQEPFPEGDPRGDELGSAGSTNGGGGGGLFGEFSESDVVGGLDLAFMTGYLEHPDALKILDAKALEWAMFDINTKAAERTWEREVKKLLDEQIAIILRLSQEHLRSAKAIDPDSAFTFINSLAKWLREDGDPMLSRGLFPLIVSTGTTGLKRAAAQVGLSFSVLQPGLLEYAAEEADFLASVMGETTGRKVAEAVQRSVDRGSLLTEFRKDLEKNAAFSRNRAKLVARTQTTRVWNGAQRRSLSTFERNSDETVRMFKTWLNAGDIRVRPAHRDSTGVGGQKRRIDETYSNGLQEPSEPHCRCTQTYDLEIIGE